MGPNRDKSIVSPLLEILGTILIVLMIVSLMWFLIGIFYRGEYTLRLCWIFGLFSAAAVLVSRISIESGRERSLLFALPLAAATVAVSTMLVQGGLLFPFLLVGFVTLVLWLADRLTWDSTVIDASRDVSAVGLVELARRSLRRPGPEGMEVGAREPVPSGSADARLPASSAKQKKTTPDADSRPGNLWRALTGFGPLRNTPGLWSLFFSLGAMVIFGVGQWLIQPDPNTGYWWVSLLFSVFVAASLSLLTLTSLFGLQRYLFSRRLEVPEGLTRRWLTVGITIACLAAVSTLLVPRPDVSGMFSRSLAWLSSRPRDPSAFGWGRDGTKSGDRPRSVRQQETGEQQDGQASSSGQDPNGQKAPGGNQGSGGQGSGGQGSGGSKPGGQSPNSENGQGQNQSGQNQSSQSQSSQSQSSQSQSSQGQENQGSQQGSEPGPSSARNQSNDSSASEQQQGSSRGDSGNQQNSTQTSPDGSRREQGSQNNRSSSDSGPSESQNQKSEEAAGSRSETPNPSDKSPDQNSDQAKQQSGNRDPQTPQQEKSGSEKNRSGSSQQNDASSGSGAEQSQPAEEKNRTQAEQSSQNRPDTGSSGPGPLSRMAGMLGKLLAILVGLIALAIAAWMFRGELARMWDEFLAWWNGKPKDPEPESDVRAGRAAVQQRRKFSALSNPFRDGRAARIDPRQLATETFAALETLAAEAGSERHADTTPHEFARALEAELPDLAPLARSMAEIYSATAYGNQSPDREDCQRMGQVWQQLERVAAGLNRRSSIPAGVSG